MQLTAKEIAELVQGEVKGDEQITFNHLSKIEEAKAGSLTFIHDLKYINYVYSLTSSIIIVPKDIPLKGQPNATLILVEHPYIAFSYFLKLKEIEIKDNVNENGPKNIAESANIHQSAKIGGFVTIGKNVIIGENTKIFHGSYIGKNSTIGKDTTILANVTIYEGSQIGDQCIIHSGCVIGSDGFGYIQDKNQNYQKIPQIGNVIIGDHVEIGANSCIDRAVLGSTVIESGVKLDNLIHIAHNVHVKKNTAIAAQTGISGSATIGENCKIGGQVGIVGHIKIADQTSVGAQAGISKSIKEPNQIYRGSPAQIFRKQITLEAEQRQIPELRKKIDNLEKQLSEILKSLNQ